MQKFLTIFILTALALPLFGQMKSIPPAKARNSNSGSIAPVTPFLPQVPAAAPLFGGSRQFKSQPMLSQPVSGQPQLQAKLSENGTPYVIEGTLPVAENKALDLQIRDYLDAVQPVLNLKNPGEEFSIRTTQTDELGFSHTRFQQVWKGVPVYGAEAILHKNGDGFYLFNGRFFPSPSLADVVPTVSETVARQIALDHVSAFENLNVLSGFDKKILGSEQTVAELVIYHPEKNATGERLAWHVTALPNLHARYQYFVDANTGEVLHHHSELCNLAGHFHAEKSQEVSAAPHSEFRIPHSEFLPPDGPATDNANDLFGTSRLIHTYSKDNVFYLIDASRTGMFNLAQSVFPDDPVGVIWTIDGQNGSPENQDFNATHVTDSDNDWNNPKAVSAHFNGAKAYEYFKSTFNRESINGQGGNIVSLINVTEDDGSQMDNAFWNGFAMFYGNGDQAFDAPLCKALDVAGHEMSHGVVQATANLEYLNESGALNESFADVFGVMIDRNDWQLGEDICNNAIFPTGALRDLSNPHNGGSNLNDNGWQPGHYSERYTGSDDNGGVHINSGIPNKAFFLFANHASVGKDKAEQVYYRALNNYLTKSSVFVDCRNAVVQAATDLHGANSAEVNAAKAAFDAVGIGAGSGTNEQTDTGTNPGDEFILMSDPDNLALYIYTPDGVEIANPLTNTDILSRPSVTDDGSALVYIAADNTMKSITIDWLNSDATEQTIQSEPIWRNVAIAKDGSRIAALQTDNDNRLHIFDFGLQQWEIFELYNPTTGEGATTGDVQYADVLEWDITGEWVMYDALNSLNTTGDDIEYWDISFIKVFDGSSGNFENTNDAYIEKLFNGLPENVSVGNPTFSKNSDYVIAFDYFDEFNDEYFLYATNLETSESGVIFENSDLSWPSYAVDDNRMVFDAFNSNNEEVLAFIGIGSDKISPSGNASVFLNGKRKGVWFANGERVLVDVQEGFAGNGIRAYPNPVSGDLTIDFSAKNSGETLVQVFDLTGRLVRSEMFEAVAGENSHRVSFGGLAEGSYLLRLRSADAWAALKVIKRG